MPPLTHTDMLLPPGLGVRIEGGGVPRAHIHAAVTTGQEDLAQSWAPGILGAWKITRAAWGAHGVTGPGASLPRDGTMIQPYLKPRPDRD